MTDQYAEYDYAWLQRGWTSQDPTIVIPPNSNPFGDPGLPDDVAKVNVVGSFLDPLSGRGLEGVLEYRISTILRYVTLDTEVMPSVWAVRFTDAQPLSVFLPATDDPNLVAVGASTWQYHFRLTVAGVQRVGTSSLPTSVDPVNVWTLLGDPA